VNKFNAYAKRTPRSDSVYFCSCEECECDSKQYSIDGSVDGGVDKAYKISRGGKKLLRELTNSADLLG
jgi:hypothetical protein